MVEKLIVFAIVALAVIFLWRHFFSRKRACGCDKCAGCGQSDKGCH
ncbi:FeoB-associated Cys-rich membrane protein [Pasteurellaceae bacterium TAE3-ERU1]|nr:FeoB-associated Cys-rich membrane protein [Pasteurellaceae bacterium TAE3-ERU1]